MAVSEKWRVTMATRKGKITWLAYVCYGTDEITNIGVILDIRCERFQNVN